MQKDTELDLFFDLEYFMHAAEAALFACGSAMQIDKVAEAIGAEKSKMKTVLEALKARYDESSSAIQVLILDDSAMLATRCQYAQIVQNALQLRKNQPLSKAALEVLAIVAYNQPTTRALIDKVRGVESPSVVASLCEKGLIEEKGRLDAPGRPVLYGTTPVFLRTFGLTAIGELEQIPEIKEYIDELKKAEEEANNSAPPAIPEENSKEDTDETTDAQ